MADLMEWFVGVSDDVKERIGDAIRRHDRLPTAQLRQVELRHPVAVAEARWHALAQCDMTRGTLVLAEQFMRALHVRLHGLGMDAPSVESTERTLSSTPRTPNS